ncbi:sugar acetyltransferase [Mesorhizobium loti]|nr:acetyltransferase [Mesorhizobium loti]PLP60069.1 sugar acetyltransferase [Mesorhizobium loti]
MNATSEEDRIAIFASGGHAIVVADAINCMLRVHSVDGRQGRIVGFVENDAKPGAAVIGLPIIGSDASPQVYYDGPPITHFVIGLGSIRGGLGRRQALFATATGFGFEALTVVHPFAYVSPLARIEAGAVVMAGAVVQPRARLGINAIVNTRASVDHDCVVGDHAHVAPGATLSGNVMVGEDSLVGVGATIKQGIRIGRGVTIGAGAVITKDVPDGAVVFGARPTNAPPTA